MPHGLFPIAPISLCLHSNTFDQLVERRVEGEDVLEESKKGCEDSCGIKKDVERGECFVAATKILFKIPLVRDLCLWMGCVDASRKSFDDILIEQKERANSLLVLPGGVREMLVSSRSSLELFLKHEGFINYSWDKKIDLVPIFAKGENRMFKTFNILSGFRNWFVSKSGYPFPTFFIGPIFFTQITLYLGKRLNPNNFSNQASFSRAFWKELFRMIVEYEELPLGPNLAKRIEQFEFDLRVGNEK